ncbi:MAG TPA: ABC transporter ATP-binding protein [Firmicutes bacterium]|jgi:ABC-2 type transport system ATP-binding protein|nr:ABC transporter ATP-binding protein [Bacillota bacterium]
MDGLQVQGIRKVYGSTAVVDNVSFEAPQGRILGVLGPNGAGKTTIIRMIMGITAPDQGDIYFTDNSVKTKGVPFSTIGYLPEERGLYKEAKVMSILLFLSGLKDVPKAQAKERAMLWLRKFELEDYAYKKVEQLSKGMAQKVQFIASILHEPKFIVLDEPFSGLDPVSQDIFKEEIRALANSGATVLLSSHQMNIVEALCDEIFLIHKGKEVVKGNLESIKERYGSFRVDLLSSAPKEAVLETHMVESVEQLAEERYRYTLKDGIKPLDFVQALPSGLDVRDLTITRPSLHDIFVNVAQGGASYEGSLEDRQLGNYA